MDIIIVCHTEFGVVKGKRVIADKTATDGVTIGVNNLIESADAYNAKITFAVMPEVVEHFPRNIKHEIGLHIHSGWIQSQYEDTKFFVGDLFLRNNSKQSSLSTVLRDYPYDEQLDMICKGKKYIQQVLGRNPTSFVAGRWCINNNTIRALIDAGFTHDCSAPAGLKSDHFDWSKLPRICMPYSPHSGDYQKPGNLPIVIVPISQALFTGSVNPEIAPLVGLPWLKACFLEYYQQNMPVFHICLHSPCMCDPYFVAIMREYLDYIVQFENVKFKFSSEIVPGRNIHSKTKVFPYIFAINKNIVKYGYDSIRSYWVK